MNENQIGDGSAQVVRLPLWKNCLEVMLRDGVEHGKVYEAKFFEEELRFKRDSMQFGLGVSEIRRELEKRGFYLTGRGQGGNQFVILPPDGNVAVMANYQRAAIDAMKRGVILGTNTRLDLLSKEDRRKHEGMLEKMAIRSALLSRTQQVRKIVEKHDPKLLAK
jgi:hypothetical protein